MTSIHENQSVLKLFRSGLDTLQIAEKFGVPESTVYRILHFQRGHDLQITAELCWSRSTKKTEE